MSDDTQHRILASLRTQAWERAKGELNAMLVTLYPLYRNGLNLNEERHSLVIKRIKTFIKRFEDDGLHE